MKNKIQSAYERMMSEGKLAPIPKPKEKLDEDGRGGGSPGKDVMSMIKDNQKRINKLEKKLNDFIITTEKFKKIMRHIDMKR